MPFAQLKSQCSRLTRNATAYRNGSDYLADKRPHLHGDFAS